MLLASLALVAVDDILVVAIVLDPSGKSED